MDYSKIKRVIERMKCSVHREPPKNIRLKKDGISFTPCCSKFQSEVEAKIISEVEKQILDKL